MNELSVLHVRAADVAVETDRAVDPAVLADELGAGQVLEAVGQQVGVGGAPLQGPELHHRDEPTQVVHLHTLVLVVHQARQVEQLGTLQVNNKWFRSV